MPSVFYTNVSRDKTTSGWTIYKWTIAAVTQPPRASKLGTTNKTEVTLLATPPPVPQSATSLTDTSTYDGTDAPATGTHTSS